MERMNTGEDKESMEEEEEDGDVGFNEGKEQGEESSSEFIDLGDVGRLSDGELLEEGTKNGSGFFVD